jgi:hypothetical protein
MGGRLIRVSDVNYDYILALKGQLERAQHKDLAMNDAVSLLIETFKAKTANERAYVLRP